MSLAGLDGERPRTTASRPCWVGADHPAFNGHFPGQPILPGVALLAAVLEAVRDEPVFAALVGAQPHLVVAKFLSPVRPETMLAIELEPSGRALGWTVRAGDRVVASGRFATGATAP